MAGFVKACHPASGRSPAGALGAAATGLVTDDGAAYRYIWDAFARLVEVEDQSSNQVARYAYNGLRQVITEHYDADEDGDVDSADPEFFITYGAHSEELATYRAGDIAPKQELVRGAQQEVVCRDRDTSSPWTSASDATLEERLYYCEDAKGCVVSVISSNGWQVEQSRYSSVAHEPFGLPRADADSDGDCDATDSAIVSGWLSGGGDVRGDVNLDGLITTADTAAISANYEGISTGYAVLSSVERLVGVGRELRGQASLERRGTAVFERRIGIPMSRLHEGGIGNLLDGTYGMHQLGCIECMTAQSVASPGSQEDLPVGAQCAGTCFSSEVDVTDLELPEEIMVVDCPPGSSTLISVLAETALQVLLNGFLEGFDRDCPVVPGGGLFGGGNQCECESTTSSFDFSLPLPFFNEVTLPTSILGFPDCRIIIPAGQTGSIEGEIEYTSGPCLL